MGRTLHHLRRTLVGALALTLSASLLGSAAVGAADGARAACDEIVMEARTGIDDALVSAPNGSNPTLLSGLEPGFRFPNEPARHPDGSLVLFVSISDDDDSGERVDILVTAAVDGTDRRVVELDTELTGRIQFDGPAWSPDGSRLAVAVEDDAGHRILTADPDGSNVAVVDFDLAGTVEYPSDPAWSLDGTRLAVSVSVDGDQHIVASDPDGSNAVAVSSVGLDAPTSNRSPSWAPDGSRLAWFGGFQREIYVANADGTGRVSISGDVGGVDPTDNVGPRWSPDGNAIVWKARIDSADVILTATPAGADRTDISSGGELASLAAASPRWSHDGTKLLWEAGLSAEGGDPGEIDLTTIIVANPDGSDRVDLRVNVNEAPERVYLRDARWSPVDHSILWSRSSRYFVSDVDGANGTVITEGPGPAELGDLRWSPDGEWIAAAGIINGVDAVILVRGDGTDLWSMPSPGSGAGDVAWMPDGSGFLWGSRTDEYTLWATDLATRTTTRFMPDTAPIVNSPTWRPDGTELLLWWDTGDDRGHRWYTPATETFELFDPTNDRAVHTWSRGVEFSADGSRLAVSGSYGTGDGEQWGLFVVDLAAMQATEISPDPGDESTFHGGAVWSPDGTQLVWETEVGEDDWDAVAIANADGSGYRILSDPAQGEADDPRWSPDGTRIAWARSYEDEETDEWVDVIDIVDLDGTVLSTIDETHTGSIELDEPLWRPRAVTPFTDVPDTSFAVDDIACIYGMAITQGTGDGTTYAPGLNVNRQQMAAFLARLWRALGNDCPDGPDHGFTDVDPDHWSSDDISCIKNLGITTGTGGGRYSPAGDVTREQMGAFLGRLWDALGNDCPHGPDHGFADVSPTSYANDHISCIKNLGLTTGTTPTTYAPGNEVTRQQMAAFIARLVRAHTER